MRRRTLRWAAVALIAGTAVAAGVMVATGQPAGPASEDHGPAVVSSAGAIKIGNSQMGRAVFQAPNLLPGQYREGRVTISNPNLQPLDLSLSPRITSGAKFAQSLELELKAANGSLYAGPLAAMPALPLGELAPSAERQYRFRVGLPAGAGNEQQGRSGSIDLVWSARAAGPPPKCRLRAMRARFFVFRGRDRIRLVSRYRAAVPGRVRVVFFQRRRDGSPGRRIGVLDARFGTHRHRWGRIRVAHRRSTVEMRRFRRSRKGYIAQLHVAGTPGYCRQYLNLDLVQLRRFYGQYVWFQRGSFRTLTTRPG